MKNLFRLLIALFAINLCTIELCSSQKITIQGKVSDKTTGEDLPGVNVYVEDTPFGTTTDIHGFYKLEMEKGTFTITYRFLGYDTHKEEVILHDNLKKDIGLSPAYMELAEVSIVAQRTFFGDMNYGRDIPSISSQEIEMQNINMASDLLHAKIAGVWATKTSGAPGDQQRVRIRGQISFFGASEPLYVIDGVPVPIVNLSSLGISHLNINDIDNVTILRDASSSSLYGYQGSNGVVLIDTKKGGKKEISFLTRVGYQQVPRLYDLHNSTELIQLLDSARSKINSPVRVAFPNITDTLCNRDWQKEVFTTGRVQEYQLSGSGNLGQTKYYLSGNYNDHEGIVKTSAYKRYTGYMSAGRNFGQTFAIDIGYRTTKEENQNNIDQYRGNNLILQGVSLPPSFECTPYEVLRDTFSIPHTYRQRTFYNNYGVLYHDSHLQNEKPFTPFTYWDQNDQKVGINSQSINLSARYQFNDHLSVSVMESGFLRMSIYSAKTRYEEFQDNLSHLTKRFEVKSFENVLLANHQLSLSYNNTYRKHAYNFLLAHRYYLDNLWWNADTIVGQIPEHYSLKNSMVAYGPSGAVVRKITSYLGHISYDYAKKYFVSMIGNVSRLKEGLYTDYYSLFPSLAISWDIAKEFPNRNMKFVDYFSLYYNLGSSGNYPLNGLSNDLYRDQSNPAFERVVYQEYEGNTYPSIQSDKFPVVEQFANYNLKHEETFESNFGVKSSYLNNRIGISGTYYKKSIYNMLILRDIPFYYGGGKMFVNVGKVDVNGYEITLDLVPIKTNNSVLQVNFSYFTSKQIIRELSDNQEMLFADNDLLMPDFIIKKGEPVGNFYGYQFLGKASAEDMAARYDSIAIFNGDKYMNLDSIPGLQPSDRTVLGNSIPKNFYNLNVSYMYKSVGIDVLWYAVSGMEKYNATRAAAVMTGLSRDAYKYIENSNQSIKNFQFYESDQFVEDASFIRLKRITLFYEPEQKVFNTANIRFSLSIENLLTFTRYTGYDPEATIFTDNNFSENGIDRGAYPNPKSVFLTVGLKF